MSGADRTPARRRDGREPRGADLADVVTSSADDAWGHAPSADAHVGQRASSSATDAAWAQVRQLGETALAAGVALGFSAAEMAAHETFERFEVSGSLSVEQVVALAEADARGWFDMLGADLSLALFLEGLDPAVEPISADLQADAGPVEMLREFQRAAQAVYDTQGDSVSVSVRLSVGKRRAQELAEWILARRREGQSSAAPEAAVVFYQAAACERLLTLWALADWGRRALGADSSRLCVFLCDCAGYLAGPALEMIGAAGRDGRSAEEAPDWLPVSRAAWRRFTARGTTERHLRDTESAWSGLSLTLTSEHLRVVSRTAGLERLAERLGALRAQVAACALASQVERRQGGQPDDLTLRFAGARPASASLTSAAPPPDLDLAARDALIDLAGWAYRDASPDKLAIARQALADTLPAGATLSLEAVCAVAAPAMDAARANLAIYLHGATERYFQLRGAAQQTVGDFASATRKSVTDLTSDVVDNLFRTVGLIVGVAIAWLIQPGASYTLAHIATALYTVYLLFIVFYLLRARQSRYQLERRGLDDTLAAMGELTQAERDRLRLPARDAEGYFERYFSVTRRIYLGLAAFSVLLFLLMFLPGVHALAAHVVLPAATPAVKR